MLIESKVTIEMGTVEGDTLIVYSSVSLLNTQIRKKAMYMDVA